MESVREVRAVAGRGLDGDRYFEGTGKYSKKPGPGRHVTLIESETLEALKRETGIDLKPDWCRRNILTGGVPLNHLVDREFRVGEVKLRGVRLCEPCAYLEKLTGLRGVRKALVHRGGLRAQILSDGLIRVGDVVEGG
ncbi:MAG: MOSC domain-containing protein [Nitrospinota bacterium]